MQFWRRGSRRRCRRRHQRMHLRCSPLRCGRAAGDHQVFVACCARNTAAHHQCSSTALSRCHALTAGLGGQQKSSFWVCLPCASAVGFTAAVSARHVPVQTPSNFFRRSQRCGRRPSACWRARSAATPLRQSTCCCSCCPGAPELREDFSMLPLESSSFLQRRRPGGTVLPAAAAVQVGAQAHRPRFREEM